MRCRASVPGAAVSGVIVMAVSFCVAHPGSFHELDVSARTKLLKDKSMKNRRLFLTES